MILGYGNYRHELNEVTVVIDQQASTNTAGARDKTKHRWTISGVLHADSVAAMTTKIRALENAYKQNGKDLVLYDADGTTPTAHALRSATSLSGTRVVSGPTYPVGNEVYSLNRAYSIVVECETDVKPDSVGNGSAARGGQNAPLRFSQSTQQSGGGPITQWITLLDGRPVKQETARHSTYLLVQSGQATGERGYPAVPAPLFPNSLREQPTISYTLDPTNEGSQNKPKVLFTVSWSYVFESDREFNARRRRR